MEKKKRHDGDQTRWLALIIPLVGEVIRLIIELLG